MLSCHVIIAFQHATSTGESHLGIGASLCNYKCREAGRRRALLVLVNNRFATEQASIVIMEESKLFERAVQSALRKSELVLTRHQKEAFQSVIHHIDTFVSLPTGHGSLCEMRMKTFNIFFQVSVEVLQCQV